MTEKQKLLQAKTDYLKAVRHKQQELLNLQASLKAIDKQLDEINEQKQGRLF